MARYDASALLSSFRDNYADLLRFLTRRTGDAGRAADVAQDTYMRLAALAPANQDIENPRAFVYRVAGNLAIDTLRREGRIARNLTFLDEGLDVGDSTPSPEIRVLAREKLKLVEAALDELPENPRLALLYSRVEEISFAEIAARLGVSESMVAKYIAQALRHCRDRLRQHGHN